MIDDIVLLGSVMLLPYNFSPVGWISCEGQLLPVTQNQALFSLIGATYGGDGRTTFAIPNLRGSEPLPTMKYYMAIEGIYPQRP